VSRQERDYTVERKAACVSREQRLIFVLQQTVEGRFGRAMNVDLADDVKAAAKPFVIFSDWYTMSVPGAYSVY
jgi:hypothetical protein